MNFEETEEISNIYLNSLSFQNFSKRFSEKENRNLFLLYKGVDFVFDWLQSADLSNGGSVVCRLVVFPVTLRFLVAFFKNIFLNFLVFF